MHSHERSYFSLSVPCILHLSTKWRGIFSEQGFAPGWEPSENIKAALNWRKMLSFSVFDYPNSGHTARPLGCSMWQGIGTIRKLHTEWGTPKRQPTGSLQMQEVFNSLSLSLECWWWTQGFGQVLPKSSPEKKYFWLFWSDQTAHNWRQHSSRRGKVLCCSSEPFIQESSGQCTHLGDLCRECRRPFGHLN